MRVRTRAASGRGRYGATAVGVGLVGAIISIASVGWAGSSERALVVLISLAGFFLIGAQVGELVLPGMIYPTYIRSTGAGWAVGIGRFGSILGPVVGGVLITLGLSLPQLFLCAAAPTLGSALAVFLLRSRSRVEDRNIAPQLREVVEGTSQVAKS